MGKIIFIIGGARSGKSSYALAAAKRYTGRVAFIATAEAGDAEMKERIRRHRKQRPAHWRTFEEPRDVQGVITDIGSRFSCVVVDCLTLLVSNLLLAGYSDSRITKKIKAVVAGLKGLHGDSIVISNEVGLGIVPDNTLGRRFRDIAGSVNQIVAAEADEVILMTAGIPLRIKERVHG